LTENKYRLVKSCILKNSATPDKGKAKFHKVQLEKKVESTWLKRSIAPADKTENAICVTSTA